MYDRIMAFGMLLLATKEQNKVKPVDENIMRIRFEGILKELEDYVKSKEYRELEIAEYYKNKKQSPKNF